MRRFYRSLTPTVPTQLQCYSIRRGKQQTNRYVAAVVRWIILLEHVLVQSSFTVRSLYQHLFYTSFVGPSQDSASWDRIIGMAPDSRTITGPHVSAEDPVHGSITGLPLVQSPTLLPENRAGPSVARLLSQLHTTEQDIQAAKADYAYYDGFMACLESIWELIGPQNGITPSEQR